MKKNFVAVLFLVSTIYSLNAVTPSFSSYAETTSSSLNLEPGIYDVTMKIWEDTNSSIPYFYSYILDPWIAIKWDISSIEKGKWVTLTKEVRIENDVTNANLRIQLYHLNDFGGSIGTLYFDDISFFRKSTIIVDTVADSTFKIYPNPATDKVSLVSENNGTVYIQDFTGKTLKVIEKNELEISIPVNTFSKGIYFLRLISVGNSESQKLILK